MESTSRDILFGGQPTKISDDVFLLLRESNGFQEPGS